MGPSGRPPDWRTVALESINCSIDEGDLPAARAGLDGLVARRQEQLANGNTAADALDLAILFQGAEVCAALSSPDAAAAYLETAGWVSQDTSLLQDASARRVRVRVRIRLALLALDGHDLDAAGRHLSEIDPALAGRALRLQHASDLAEFEALYPWLEEPPDSLLAMLYLVAARFLAAHGRFGPARLVLRRSEANLGEPDDGGAGSSDLVIRHDLECVHVALQVGDIQDARRRLERHSPERLRHNRLLSLKWTTLASRAAVLSGDLAGALEFVMQAVQIAVEFRSPAVFVKAALNAARGLMFVNRNGMAVELIERITHRFPNRLLDPFRGELEFLLGLARQRQLEIARQASAPIVGQTDTRKPQTVSEGRFAQGAEVYGRTDEPVTESSDYEAEFNHRVAVARVLLEHAPSPAVEGWLEALIRFTADTDSPLIRGRMLQLLGLYSLRRRNLEAAVSWLEKARQQFSIHETLLDRWQCLSLLGSCYFVLGRRRLGRSVVEEAESLLRRATVGLSTQDTDLFLLDKWTDEELGIQLRLERLQALSSQRPAAAFSRARGWLECARIVLDVIREASRYRGSVLDGVTRRQTDPGPADSRLRGLWELATASARCATITFIVMGTQTLVVASSRLHLDWSVAPVGRAEIRKTVRLWHLLATKWAQQLSRDPQCRRTEQSIARLRRLAGRLSRRLRLDELLERLPRRVGTLRLRPDDALHTFPFGALPIGTGYLAERFDLEVSFGFPESRRPRASLRDGWVVHVSDSLSDSSDTLPELKGAPAEAALVGRLLEEHRVKVHRLPESDGSSRPVRKRDLVERLDTATYLHVACHGVFRKHRPFESGLALVGANGNADLLTIRDILAMSFQRLDHVGLSACFTADAYTLPGRWVVSLPEAFCRAGARRVVAFLWPLADDVAPALMERYYRYFEKQGASRAVAAAQKACLQSEVSGLEKLPLHHPYFWAGLVTYRR